MMLKDDSEENKLFYIGIYEEYQETVENYTEGELMKRIEGFDICVLCWKRKLVNNRMI